MTEPAITLAEVRKALATLKRQGHPDPGVHRIRAHLGRGSVTTINKYKHAILLEESKQLLPGTRKPIPDPITELAARIWEELHGAIDTVDDEREQATAAALADMQREMDSLRDTLARETARAQQMQRDLATAAEQQRETAAALDKAHTEIQRTRHTLELRDQTVAHLQEQIETLRADLVSQGKQAVERETSLKRELDNVLAERRGDQQQAEAQRANLQDQISAWQRQFEQQHRYFEGQIASRDQQTTALRQDIASLTEDKARLADALQHAKERANELEIQLQVQIESRDDMRKARDNAAEALLRSEAQHAQERTSMEQTFAELRETITVLRQQIQS